MQQTNKALKLSELIHGLDATIQGDPDSMIHGISPLQHAKAGHLSFLTNSLYKKHLQTTQATAVVLSVETASDCPVTAIIASNPYYVYAQMAQHFNHVPAQTAGIHPTAIIGENCEIHPTVNIGANSVIGNAVKINANSVIGPGCFIGDHTTLDESVAVEARVTIYHGTQIGKRTRIASGVVIGSEGFGFANHQGSWVKVPQLGNVVIGDDVDIGANTTIDRGAIEDTVIENGVKMDNLIQIAHNVRVGANTIMAGCSAVAGSTTIGKNCMVGGIAAIAGHLTITDNVMINGGAMVTKSITEPGIYASGLMGLVTNHEFRKNSARFNRLEQLQQRVKKLEATLKELTERHET